MNKYITLVFIALCMKTAVSAQCPIAPLTLNSQAQVDAFPTNYPGCTDMLVLLTVTGNSITNLDGLNGIQTTANSLILRDNPQLASLSGLSNLTSIAVELKIENNDLLTSLSGLDNLTWLGGHLSIEGNAQLATLDGIGPIPSLGSYLNISFNPVLTDVTALSSLTEVGPNYINGFLAINNNNSLPAINGLDLISETGSYFFLGSNPVMTTINGLNGLSIVNGDFEIAGNPMLNNLNAFAGLTTIDGNFNVDNNPALTDLDEFVNMSSVTGNLTIASNASLSDCAAQGICDYVAGPGNSVISSNAVGCNTVGQVAVACALLPVELTYFGGKPEGNGVMLNWITASEQDNAWFEVEFKGLHDPHFQTIGKKTGNGTSAVENKYTFFHAKPAKGLNYYRLRQVDFDGHSEYSDILSVYIDSDIEPDIFPNPTRGPIIVKGSATTRSARITDLAGKEILTKDLTESSLVDLSDQPNGVYLLEIQADGRRLVKRVVKN
ncbi:MAG: T9SS type A sorting domain-containing protein [Lewinellaceae bacterium]|nr:T9SS type A sorting domain-containing protein [Lewinellaceae bacterium]